MADSVKRAACLSARAFSSIRSWFISILLVNPRKRSTVSRGFRSFPATSISRRRAAGRPGPERPAVVGRHLKRHQEHVLDGVALDLAADAHARLHDVRRQLLELDVDPEIARSAPAPDGIGALGDRPDRAVEKPVRVSVEGEVDDGGAAIADRFRALSAVAVGNGETVRGVTVGARISSRSSKVRQPDKVSTPAPSLSTCRREMFC